MTMFFKKIFKPGAAGSFSICAVLAICLIGAAYAAEDNRDGNVAVPEGMEIIKEGGVNILVPKGSKLSSAGSYLVKEDPEQYASRKFVDMEERFNKLDKEIESMKEDIKSIKEAVNNASKEKAPQANAENIQEPVS